MINSTSKEQKIRDIMNFIVENNATIGQAARFYNMAFSTVQKYIRKLGPEVDPELAEQANKIVDQNSMRKDADERIKKIKETLEFIIENNVTTLKQVAEALGISESTVSRYLHKIGQEEDPELAQRAIKALEDRKNAYVKDVMTYVIENDAVLKQAAEHFNICPVTVQRYIRDSGKKIDPELAGKASEVLERNKSKRGRKK